MDFPLDICHDGAHPPGKLCGAGPAKLLSVKQPVNQLNSILNVLLDSSFPEKCGAKSFLPPVRIPVLCGYIQQRKRLIT